MKLNFEKRRLLALIAVLAAATMSLTACNGAAPAQSSDTETSTSQPAEISSQAESSAVETAPPAAAAPSARDDSDANKAAYLTTYFGVTLSATPIQGEFVEALLKLQPEGNEPLELAAPQPAEPLTALEAVRLMVAGANLEELALVYTPEKTAAALTAAAVTVEDPAYASYVACALDLGMVSSAQAETIAINDPVDAALANSLLMAAADHNGTSRHFIGYTDDPDIFAEIINAWEGFALFDDEKLSAIGSEAVTQQVTTGYNLKSSQNDARFLPELSLSYGHSDIKHAQQLIGLLRSEGVVARVQLEPKVSIYQYLPEWGEPGDPTPTYMVKTVSETLMLAYATEYDLILEFASTADRDKLDALVLEYAKKNTGEEDKLLLHGAWWQPLYVSHVEMGDGYTMIYDNVITNGNYSLHPFCLAENKDDVLAKFKAIDSTVEIEQIPIWCDAPFYRYLNGEAE